MSWLTQLLALINSLIADRTRLALENAAHRQQIIGQKRSVKRTKIEDSDRIFRGLLRRMLASWRDALIPVEPETVITVSSAHARWHRKGWRYYWARKSKRGNPGRPPIDSEIIELITRMSKDNALWGVPNQDVRPALRLSKPKTSWIATSLPPE